MQSLNPQASSSKNRLLPALAIIIADVIGLAVGFLVAIFIGGMGADGCDYACEHRNGLLVYAALAVSVLVAGWIAWYFTKQRKHFLIASTLLALIYVLLNL